MSVNVCLHSVSQEACSYLWPETEYATIYHYDVNCKEFQPFNGYDVIKLEVASLTSVSVAVWHMTKIMHPS